MATSKRPNTTAIWMLALVGAMGVAAFAGYVQSTPAAQTVAKDLRRPEPPKTTPTPESAAPAKDAAPQVLVPVFQGEGYTLGNRESVPSGMDAKTFAATEAAKAVKVEGARALGVEIKDKVAIVTFNDAAESGMGSEQEANFAEAMQVAFGQFADVEKLRLMVGDHALQGGHFDFSEPLDVIRPASGKTGP